MSKSVKISLTASVLVFVITILALFIFPVLRISNRIVDIFVVTFISCLIFYVFTYLFIRGLERRDEERKNK